MKAITGIFIIVIGVIYLCMCGARFGWTSDFAPVNDAACICTGILFLILAIGLAVAAQQK